MADQDTLELSKSGLKLSYLRFLADAAGGVLALSTLLLATLLEMPVPGTELDLGELSSLRPDGPQQIFMLAFILLLVTPFGLFLNGLGWVVLGRIQLAAVVYLFRHPRTVFASGTSKLWSVDKIKQVFALDDESSYGKAIAVEQLIGLKYPSVYDSMRHVEGLKRFLRTIVLLTLFWAVYLMTICSWTVSLGLLLLVVFGIGFLAILDYYYILGVLFKAVCLAGASRDLGVFNEKEVEVMESLLAEAPRESETREESANTAVERTGEAVRSPLP